MREAACTYLHYTYTALGRQKYELRNLISFYKLVESNLLLKEYQMIEVPISSAWSMSTMIVDVLLPAFTMSMTSSLFARVIY